MAEALILDSEALHALARPKDRSSLFHRANAIVALAHERQALVRVPAPVLAEVCRGPRFAAAIDYLLNDRGIGVLSLTRSIAQRAGSLLTKARMTSHHAVDAFVASTALEFDSAVVATSDPDDMQRLLGDHPKARVFRL
jgi:predicted nucleic acid-binding protein